MRPEVWTVHHVVIGAGTRQEREAVADWASSDPEAAIVLAEIRRQLRLGQARPRWTHDPSRDELQESIGWLVWLGINVEPSLPMDPEE